MELDKNKLPCTFTHVYLFLEGGLHQPVFRQIHGYSVSRGINHARGLLDLLQTVSSALFGAGCVINLTAAVKPFMVRIFCLELNVSVSRRMIIEGDVYYQIGNCSSVIASKGLKGEAGPCKNCLFWFQEDR